MSWRRCLQERMRRALPARLEVASLLDGEAPGWPSPLMALPGAQGAPGLVRFGLAPVTCEAIAAQGLRFLEQARQARGRLPDMATRLSTKPATTRFYWQAVPERGGQD